MSNIKTALIHLLGGLTIEESKESDYNSFMIGKVAAYSELREYANSINGCSAMEWCEHIYARLEKETHA